MRSDVPSGDVLAAGSIIRTPVIRSWLGGELLADDVPITSGSVTWTTGQDIPGACSLSVPRHSPGMDWLPSHPEHPLGRYGQILDVLVRFTAPVSRQEWDVRLGSFKVYDWDESPDGGSVSINAQSMFLIASEDRLVRPVPTRRAGTMASEARRLLPSSLGMVIDAGLADRSMPRTTWEDSKLESLYDIADSWPARLRESPWGEAVYSPPLPDVPKPVGTLTDGQRGTVVSAPRMDTRASVYNRVVARGQETTEAGQPSFQGIADLTTGPMRVGGHYGTVTRFYASPLLTTRAQAEAAAASMVRSSAMASQTIPVTLAPDPRWELDDAVEVVRGDARWWGYVTGIEFPLTINDGPMRLDVGVME